MRQATIAGAVAIAALFGLAPLSAQAVEFDLGPGGVHVYHGHRWDRAYDRDDCRVIITHRTNRWGDDVTVRRHVCD